MSGDSGRKRTAASLAARYGLAALLLLAVFASVPVERAWQALASVSGAPLALAAVALTLSRWIGALRTRTLVRRHGVELTTARLFEISCVSTLYGLALPGSMSGGVVRWYRIGQLQRSHSEAAAAIGFERVVDYTVLVWLGLLAWGWDGDAPRAPQLSWALALSAAALSLLCGLSLSRIPTRVARRIAARPDSESGWSRRLRGAAVQSLDALPRHRTASTVWTTLALSVGVHLVASVGITALAEALSLGLALVTVLWLRAFTVVITAAPLTPAGLGVREIGSVYLLGLIGVEAPLAVAFSALQFAAILFFAGWGGLFEAHRQLAPSEPA